MKYRFNYDDSYCYLLLMHIRDISTYCVCRERRCLNPLLPSNILSSKFSPANDSAAYSCDLSKNVVANTDNSTCKDLSSDETASSKSRQAVVDVSSPGDSASDVPLTSSAGRRGSQKFSNSVTWSRFRQQKAATAFKSHSEKVILFQMCVKFLISWIEEAILACLGLFTHKQFCG